MFTQVRFLLCSSCIVPVFHVCTDFFEGRLVTCVLCCWLLMGVDVKSVSVHTSAVLIVFILYCPCISRVHGLL